jgi:hypothetical protein
VRPREGPAHARKLIEDTPLVVADSLGAVVETDVIWEPYRLVDPGGGVAAALPARRPSSSIMAPGASTDAAVLRPAGARLTSADHPSNTRGGTARRGRSRRGPGHAGHRRATATASPADTNPGIGQQHHQ